MSEKSTIKKLGFWVGIFAFILFSFGPTLFGMPPTAQKMAGIGLLMACWWLTDAIPIPATAMVPIFLYAPLEIASTKATAAKYSNQFVFLFLGGFIIAAAMERWNLHRRIALNIVLRSGTGPRQLIFGFMIATAFLSMFISNTATTMMMVPIAIAVVNTLSEHLSIDGLKKTFGMSLMLAIAYAANTGGMTTLVGTPPNIVFSEYYSTNYGTMTFSKWLLMAFPFVATFFVFMVVYFLFFCDIGVKDMQAGSKESKQVIEEALKKLGKMSTAEKRVLLVFAVTVFLWIFRSPIETGLFEIPGWATLFPNPKYMHDTTVAIAASVLLFALPSGEIGTPLLDWNRVSGRIPWGTLILFGGGFALAMGFQESGLAQFIGDKLVVLKELPTPILVAIVFVVIAGLTELSSNLATINIFLPILGSLSVTLGLEPIVLLFPATIAVSCAFMFPVATPPNAIVFGSGWIRVSEMAKKGVALNLGAGILMVVYLLVKG